MLKDSLDKIIGIYFTCVTAEPFTYKGREYSPKTLRVSPMILRGYTCPPMCAGCCSSVFSLDYLPQDLEKWPHNNLQPRMIKLNDWEMPIYSDLQLENQGARFCKNVRPSDGRCRIHGRHPFSCDFELIRFLEFQGDTRNILTQKLYGRGWAMMKVTGDRGALCEMLPVDDFTKKEVIRKLNRLKTWVEYFNLKHKVDPILDWVKTGDTTQPLVV